MHVLIPCCKCWPVLPKPLAHGKYCTVWLRRKVSETSVKHREERRRGRNNADGNSLNGAGKEHEADRPMMQHVWPSKI